MTSLTTSTTRTTAARVAQVGDVRVTHPDRLIYARPRVRKIDLLHYYEAVAPAMLAELQRRPISLVRCTGGEGAADVAVEHCFFQRHIERPPRGVRAVAAPNPKLADYAVIGSQHGVLALAQYGAVEFHTWGSLTPRLERADRMILDLDPDPGLPWRRVIETARRTRELLAALGLPALLKTTGGKGLHIVTPLKYTLPWDDLKPFARAIAEQLSAAAPASITATMSKARRRDRVFVDYLRNAEGATAVAAYSLRARPGAPVSMPIDWDELDAKVDLRGAHFHIGNVRERVEKPPRQWRDYESLRVRVTKAIRSKLERSMSPASA